MNQVRGCGLGFHRGAGQSVQEEALHSSAILRVFPVSMLSAALIQVQGEVPSVAGITLPEEAGSCHLKPS